MKKNKLITTTTQLQEQGFAIVNSIYSDSEIDKIISCINKVSAEQNFADSTKHLFAIRQVLKKIPHLADLLFTEKFQILLNSLFDESYFLTKAIYFDKPSDSNWFVAYHQDLSIAVEQKQEVSNYKNWTFKKGQYGVQPPLDILKNMVTIRIHLDKTERKNGALKVIPTSHLKGIYRPETIDWTKETEHICEVEKGDIMLMKPLTLHASNRTTNGKQRRVLHLEFSSKQLVEPLQWLEYFQLPS